MKIVKDILELCEDIMEHPKHVNLSHFDLDCVCTVIEKENLETDCCADLTFKGILIELVASSINYCYWYGNSSIRPMGMSASGMMNLVYEAFDNFGQWTYNDCIKELKNLLVKNRFPLLEERLRHLDQLSQDENYRRIVSYVLSYVNNKNHNNFKLLFNQLLKVPSFSNDVFLKRANLFFIQLYRKFDILGRELSNLIVPADYQIPRVLNHLNCLIYSEELDNHIWYDRIIPKSSLMEVEIRAATILAVDYICRNTGINISDVDTFLFRKKYDIDKPFHLTLTTDY